MYDNNRKLYAFQKRDIRNLLKHGYKLALSGGKDVLEKFVPLESGKIRHCIKHLDASEYFYTLEVIHAEQ